MNKLNQKNENFSNPLKGVFKKVDFFSFSFNCQKCETLNTKMIFSDVPTDVACSKCGKVHIAYPETILKDYLDKSVN